MSILKSTFSSMGTAAGVAWPLFGIVSSTLSLGGPLVMGVGSLCGILFLLVSIPTFYIVYDNARQDEQRVNEKLNKQLFEFIENFYTSGQVKIRQNRVANFEQYLSLMIKSDQDNDEQDKMQMKLLQFILTNDPDFFRKYERTRVKAKTKKLEKIIKNFLGTIDPEQDLSPMADTEVLKIAFIGFVGAFGAVAGCSTGVMGVLVAVGLLAGFGAMPILGAIALGLAVVVGVCTAGGSVYTAVEKDKKIKLYKDFKSYNRDFIEEFPVKNNPQLSSVNDIDSEYACHFSSHRSPLSRKIVNPAKVESTLFSLATNQRGALVGHAEELENFPRLEVVI